MTKKKNPLYVVTNDGKDVQAADGVIEALCKKLGLEPVVQFFQAFIESILQQVNSYAMLKSVNEMLTNLLAQIDELAKKIAPGFFIFRT